MANIVDLAAARSERREHDHMTGSARCLGCQHQWEAVAPIGTTELECPACGLKKGRFANPVVRGDVTWTCACSNDLFRISGQAQVYCANCGAIQEGWFK